MTGPQQQQQQQQQPTQRFTFVSFTSPGEAKGKANKKRIRSAAAFSGWEGRLGRPRPQEELPVNDEVVTPESEPPELVSDLSTRSSPRSELGNLEAGLLEQQYRINRSRIAVDSLLSDDIHDTYLGPSTPPESPQISASFQGYKKPAYAHSQQSSYLPRRFSGAPQHSENRISKANTSKKRISADNPQMRENLVKALSRVDDIGYGTLDPFNSYPVPNEPWYDWILHHMLTVFAPRGWPALGITNTQGMNWERFMTQHALQEPALFYVRLLFASGDLINLKRLSVNTSLVLRTRAIQCINEALNDPTRAVSDAMILAVGRIALHESLYGDRTAANSIHRPAQARMIAIRGGIDALDFPELVKRLMRWSDRTMSLRSGTPRLIPDSGNSSFTLTQSVRVLEKWVPGEGAVLDNMVQELDDATETG